MHLIYYLYSNKGAYRMHKDTLFYKKHTIRFGTKLLNITSPKIMGILNITPDSFFDGGHYTTDEAIKMQLIKLVEDGADIIDVGAFSSRPGAEEVSSKKEFERLKQALSIIRTLHPDVIISVDTFRSEIASRVVDDFDVNMINDISAGKIDPEILDVVAEKRLPFVSMHMQGTPKTMQNKPVYKHIVKDILGYFAEHVTLLRQKGIRDIIIDPGFGFGKTLEHNYQLLAGLDIFQMLEVPILIGISRKSMIYKLLNQTPETALTGTIALNMIALQKGASILRVHDVKEANELITIYQKLLTESEKSINLLAESTN